MYHHIAIILGCCQCIVVVVSTKTNKNTLPFLDIYSLSMLLINMRVMKYHFLKICNLNWTSWLWNRNIKLMLCVCSRPKLLDKTHPECSRVLKLLSKLAYKILFIITALVVVCWVRKIRCLSFEKNAFIILSVVLRYTQVIAAAYSAQRTATHKQQMIMLIYGKGTPPKEMRRL